ncbi:MAG: indolepyruvate oxidoreductase subunit beta [Planctomycetota bacterium]
MKYDIILCGVGGQGILTIATLIDRVALRLGLEVKQAEVHGMAQRGGAVESHLRLADGPIASDLIPKGKADMILAVEPMETLRYLSWLADDGAVVASTTPFVNIPNYPDIEEVLSVISKFEKHVLVDSKTLAKDAGNVRAENTVMLGAASGWLPVDGEVVRTEVAEMFKPKGEKLVEVNERAFDLGRAAALEAIG